MIACRTAWMAAALAMVSLNVFKFDKGALMISLLSLKPDSKLVFLLTTCRGGRSIVLFPRWSNARTRRAINGGARSRSISADWHWDYLPITTVIVGSRFRAARRILPITTTSFSGQTRAAQFRSDQVQARCC